MYSHHVLTHIVNALAVGFIIKLAECRKWRPLVSQDSLLDDLSLSQQFEDVEEEEEGEGESEAEDEEGESGAKATKLEPPTAAVSEEEQQAEDPYVFWCR